MYFGESVLLEKDKIDYENPAGRKLVADEKNWDDSIIYAEIQAGDAIDVELKNTLETFNEKKQKLLLESNDIVKDYNEFVKLNFDKNIVNRKFDNEDEDHCASYSKYFSYLQRDLQSQSGNAEFKRSIKTEYHQLDDPEMIRKVVQCRVKYIEGMNAILREMVNHNGELLGLNSNQIEAIIKDLDTDRTNYAMAEIKTKIYENKDKFVKDDGRILDLRPLGHGVMICADDDSDHNMKSPDNILLAIQQCMSYDLIINGHGNSRKKSDIYYSNYNDKDIEIMHSALVKQIQNKLIDFLNKKGIDCINDEDYEVDDGDKSKWLERRKRSFVNRRSKDLSEEIIHIYNLHGSDYFDRAFNHNLNNIFKKEYYDELKIELDKVLKSKFYDKYYSNYSNKNYVKHKTGNKWTISPIRYLDGKEYTDIKTLLKIAKQDGFERIKILSCNPEGLDLPKDLKKNVTFSKYSIFKESDDIDVYDSDYLEEKYSDINAMLDEMEFEYKSLAESYNIDYSDIQYLNECYNYFANQEYLHEENFEDNICSLVEGKISDAFDKILELIKKAIGFFVGLIRKFIDLIKQLIEKVKAFIGKKKPNKVKESTVKASFITASKDSAKVTDPVEIESQKQLEDIYTKQIKDITQTMKQNTDEQVRLEKDLESKIKQLESKQGNS